MLSFLEERTSLPSDRAGRYERQPGGFRAFIPADLPPPHLEITESLASLLSSADIALGRLDGVVRIMPDSNRFLYQYVRREAVLSSQIEGTHASMMDVLEFEAEQERGETQLDVSEVINYMAAMNHGLERLADIPLSRRLMCEVHAILMKDVRGGEASKTPGQFRTSQNWIGGGSPATARFVPPPPNEISTHFASLETFLHEEDHIPPLIKIGLAHAQFETIHPFLDGNGRTGRLLITFWLVAKEILNGPHLYMSLYFKENKDEYINRLEAIRDEGSWEDWLEFFLDGAAQVATEATETAVKIIDLRERDRSRIGNALGRRSANGLALHDYLFRNPMVTARGAGRILGVSQPTVDSLLADLMAAGIRLK